MTERDQKTEKNFIAKDDRGMTIVEVMVGFVILTIIMAGVYQLIRFSSNMMYESKDMRNGQTAFEEELYKTSPTGVVDRHKETTLGKGAYVLEPASESAKKPGAGDYTATKINMFSSADKSINDLYSYGYSDSADYSDTFGIKVYGFE